jgi:hypothetical protein
MPCSEERQYWMLPGLELVRLSSFTFVLHQLLNAIDKE